MAGDLRRHELLVDAELADAGEHPREREKHPSDVVGGVHVGGIEAGDHRVDARLLRLVQGPVFRGDDGVDERVVVERRIREQVVVRRPVARDEVVPLLLQRDAEHRDPPDAVADDLEVLLRGDAALDVVQQVEVNVVEQRGVAGGRRVVLFRLNNERRQTGEQQQPDDTAVKRAP